MSITQDNGNRADREKLKTYFETGDRPTEEEFSQTIDSWINQLDDDLHAIDQKIGIGTDAPKSKLHVKSAGGDASNSDGIFRVDSTGGGAEGSIHFGVLPKDHTWIQSKEKVPLHINPVANNTIINLKAGNVGIGTNNPTDKLQVGNGISKLVFGSAYDTNTGWGTSYIGFNLGRKQGNWFTNTDTSNNGGAVIYGDVDGNIRFSTVKTASPANGLTLTDAQVKQNTKVFISGDGNVGVGTDSPQSKLHVHQIGNTTGLKLSGQTSAAIGDILTLDSTGNAKWLPPTSVTSGLWKTIVSTGHIENGNGGNVGIGTNAPTEKLHINGSLKLDTSSNDIVIFNDTNYPNGSNKNAYPFTIIDQTGSRGFRFYSNGNSSHAALEAIRIEPAGNLRVNNHKIYLRSGTDPNHGMVWMDKDKFDNPTGKLGAIVETVVDGPYVFGYQGGALGTLSNGHTVGFDSADKNVALQWKNDKSVNFNGRVLARNKPLFIIKRFFIGLDYGNGGGRNYNEIIYKDASGNDYGRSQGRIINYRPSDYKAIVAGFQFDTVEQYNNKQGVFKVIINEDNGYWRIDIDYPNNDNHHYVEVLFINLNLF